MASSKKSTISDEENFSPCDKTGHDAILPEITVPLEEDEIFRVATEYTHYKRGDISMKDLAAFDSSVHIGITVDDENGNLREEIRRLVTYASHPRQPDLFDSDGSFGDINAAGFEDLYDIADQIISALFIIRHDNAMLLMDHYVSEYCYDIIMASRRQIRARFVDRPVGVAGHQPHIIKDDLRNALAYHAIVDYAFHSLAWWLVRITEKQAFRKYYLAVMARWMVKLKMIALDPAQWAEDSLSRSEDIMRRISSDQSGEDVIKVEFRTGGPVCDKKAVIFPHDLDKDWGYYNEGIELREGLNLMVQTIIYTLYRSRFPIIGRGAMEVRTLMHRGGLDQALRLFNIQSDGAIETSSDLAELKRSYPALMLLLANSCRLAETVPDQATMPEQVAELKWSVKRKGSFGSELKYLRTTKIDHVVSILVPLAIAGCSDTILVLDKKLLNTVIRTHHNEPLPSALQIDPNGFPRIEYTLTIKRNRTGESWDLKGGPGILPPFKAPLIASVQGKKGELLNWIAMDHMIMSLVLCLHFGLTRLKTTETQNEIQHPESCDADTSELELKREAMQVLLDYNARKSEIKTWTVTHDAVRVRTTRYSSIVLVVAIAVIMGSIPIPFLVKDDLPGVDPFQFITFSWLLVGAFLVGAKERYVENWPWHDFLRGQVVCRSISELAVASRTDRQAVLLHLLHHEHRHPLKFAGPYPGVFSHKDANGGFIVDVATRHATVLVAGFIVTETRALLRGVWERHTVLQDTREGQDGEELVFEKDELSGEIDGKKKLNRMSNEKSERKYDVRREILGLSTMDCNFT